MPAQINDTAPKKHFIQRVRTLCFCIALLLTGNNAQSQETYEIRYLGNMGVAILHKDSAVIIDGLHDYYGDAYLPTDTAAIRFMLAKLPPYRRLMAIAFTHRHGDHFDSSLATRVAAVHPGSWVIGGSQTRSSLGPEGQKRFRMISGKSVFRLGPNLQIEAVQVPHTYPQRHAAVENYRIELNWNGFRLVHLGDADVKNIVFSGLMEEPDVMVIPNWYLSKEGTEMLRMIKPAQIVISHIAPGDSQLQPSDKLNIPQQLFKKYGDKLLIGKK